MKKYLTVLTILSLLLVGFVLHIFISTGYFREITNSEDFEVIAEIPLKGAEDLTISYDDRFMIISQDDRAGRRDGEPSQGHLYFLDLETHPFVPKKLTSNFPLSFYPHGISLLKLDSAHYQLLVVNHARGHTIEKFELLGDSLVYKATYRDERMVSPNDVVAVDEESFYYTNDHKYTEGLGRLAEDYLGIGLSNVVYYDGSHRVVAEGIKYANGININHDRSQILVASPRDFSLHRYTILEDHTLANQETIDVGTGIDNIELDEDGNLWFGAHPNLLSFTAYASGAQQYAPSEVVVMGRDGQIASVYANDGALVAASSVAAPYKELLFIGTVMDDKLLVLKNRGM